MDSITNYWLLIALGFLAGGFAAINKFGERPRNTCTKWALTLPIGLSLAPEPMQVGDKVVTQKSLYTGLFVIGESSLFLDLLF